MQEPFLINSPRRRRRRGSGGRFVSSRRRRRSRRRRNNPIVLANPRRRRRGRRHYGRRRYRRNPSFGGTIGQLRGLAPKVGWGAVGALGTEIIPSFAGRFVPLPAGPVAGLAIKAGSGLATAYLVKRFVGKAQGNAAAVGALLSLALEPVKAWVLPMVGVGAYLPSEVGAYLPSNPIGYLGPGQTVAGFGDYMDVDRLSADERL